MPQLHSPSRLYPCLRFTESLAVSAQDSGPSGSLVLSRKNFAFSASCRFITAHKYRLDHAYSYEDYDEALSQVDAVYLALPNHLHREYAVRAAESRVHVLCEKPMAVTEEECQEMIAAAERNEVKLMIAYRLHFEAGNLEAIRIAESGRLGDLRIFTSEFAQQIAPHNVRDRSCEKRRRSTL